MAQKATTKKCPECGNTNLIRCSSMNTKTCTDWRRHKDKKNITMDWYIEKNQKADYT